MRPSLDCASWERQGPIWAVQKKVMGPIREQVAAGLFPVLRLSKMTLDSQHVKTVLNSRARIRSGWVQHTIFYLVVLESSHVSRKAVTRQGRLPRFSAPMC